MRHLALTLGLAGLLLLPSAGSAAEATVYGDGVALAETTLIADILADPDAWDGKVVRVEGKVRGVCAIKGCWMELESPQGQRLRIKVEDDVIVFPRDAKGRLAVAQGIVEVRELSRPQYEAWLRHLAEEQGEELDPSSLGDGPFRLVQIAGSGAEIR